MVPSTCVHGGRQAVGAHEPLPFRKPTPPSRGCSDTMFSSRAPRDTQGRLKAAILASSAVKLQVGRAALGEPGALVPRAITRPLPSLPSRAAGRCS